ncbi:uncharacterized protein LOC132278376 [Cornus florida]|uniref:uncharacterized protein LOC132278376 n=1 Tax=Cornus florida TaxID=4283 RepID=UPI002898CB0C|nr:uncharacterized protein LOC132278376 [Cornus florida]
MELEMFFERIIVSPFSCGRDTNSGESVQELNWNPHGLFEKSLNATFIAFIPKKGGVLDIRDFCPISLVGCFYKLIAKVLASRLRKVLDDVISDSQNAFMGGCQILDSVLITSEYVDFNLSSEILDVLCKLDIEKTALTGFFSSSRGLRQRDHLSPFFFLFVMEALSKLIQRAVDLGCLIGFRVGRDVASQLEISRLMFANDTLMLCDANAYQLRYLRCVLVWFQVVSGLKVNIRKNILMPVREVPEIEMFAQILGCRTGSFPISYLGLPLGAPSRCVES